MDFEKDEYDIQYYGFPLRDLILIHQINVNNKIEECVKMFTDKLIKRLEDNKASPQTITAIAKCAELTTKNIYDSFKDYLKKFEDLVEKHLRIPDNVILPDNLQHKSNCNEIEFQNLQIEVNDMEKSFNEHCYILITLEAEKQMYKIMEPIIEKEIKLGEKVQETFDEFNKNYEKIDGIIDRIKLEKKI